MEKQPTDNTLTKNKKAFADYQILEKYEAGFVLSGAEVKSIRGGNVNLKSSYASIENGEIIAKNIHISPYKPAEQKNYDPVGNRKLLLNKKEIIQIENELATEGKTLIPLSLYLKKGKIKVCLGLCQGKKHYDKRQDLKKKAQDLEIRRVLKKY
jgi:SsrA-binding protein